jgi:hypothetical protein
VVKKKCPKGMKRKRLKNGKLGKCKRVKRANKRIVFKRPPFTG